MKLLNHNALSAVLALFLVGSVPVPAGSPRMDHLPWLQEVWKRTELYFGASRPDGTSVTTAEFMQFMDRQVTPRFPAGLTLLTGYGQYLDSTGVLVKERSMVLILLYPQDAKDADAKIQCIREQYKQDYGQESVLRVDNFAWVSF